jgi:diguanylate cyclase (GGDEF)-like protein
MSILLIDDSPDELLLIRTFLRSGGYEVVTANSMTSALEHLMNQKEPTAKTDLILLDVLMPEDDGLRACRRIKAIDALQEIPIIMVSTDAEPATIQLAFAQGAIDYIRKPVVKAELLTRVRLVLKLREEMSMRQVQGHQIRELTHKLEEANKILQTLSGVDPITGLLSWGRFDQLFSEEWERAAQEDSPLSLVFFNIADFKTFNDTYGYVTGDECLQQLANATKHSLTGVRQVAARYRGAEFMVMLPEVGKEQAASLSHALRKNIESLELGLSLHIGVATAQPNQATSRITLLALVKEALLRAKRAPS